MIICTENDKDFYKFKDKVNSRKVNFFIKAKKSFEIECQYCGGPSFPIRTSEDK